MDVEEFAALLPDARRGSDGWFTARCPSHDDSSPSLRFKAGDRALIVKCMTEQCSLEEILKAMGVSMSELFYEPPQRQATVTPLPGVVVEHVYERATGEPFYSVFRGRNRITGKKKIWTRGLPEDPDERVIYHLPDVIAARDAGETVYVVEGESDADCMAKAGFVATTNVGGAGKWRDVYTAQMKGVKKVFVIADDDAAGRPHAIDVARRLRAAGIETWCYLPAEGHKDIRDHIEAGLDLGKLRYWPQEEATADDEGLVLVRLSDVTPKPIPWAWANYLPKGSLVYLEGDPAASKSTVSIDLAARFTTGDVMPDGSANGFGGPVDVIMLSAEDDPEYTIAPRAIAAGADRSRLHVVAAATEQGVPFDLSQHLTRLRASVIATGARVITIDPLATYMGESFEKTGGGDSAVRRALQPLFDLGRELDVLVIVVRHLNKNAGGRAMTRSSGSVAYVAIARASFIITRHPEEPELRVLAPLKTNLVPESDVPALSYRLDSSTQPGGIKVAKVTWMGAVDVTAQEALDGGDEDGIAKSEFREVLLGVVADGPKSFAELLAAAKSAMGNSVGDKKVRKQVNAMLRKGYPPGEGRRGCLYVAPGAIFPWEQTHVAPHVATPDQPIHPYSHVPVSLEDQEAELLARPKVCEICDQPGMPFTAPWWVIRCGVHNPITRGG